MRRACTFAIAACVAVAAGIGTARAEEIVELHYRAPAGCPSRETAVALIRERAPAVRFADGAPRVFAISVTAGERGYTGALVVDATADKQLSANRCDDLVTALA